MSNLYSACRRFERMFPGIAYQESLRATDSEEYKLHMKSLNSSSRSSSEGKLIAKIIWVFNQEGNLIEERTERVNQ
ncbi:hypothetical protein ES703_87051 [subsurface metagenome]